MGLLRLPIRNGAVARVVFPIRSSSTSKYPCPLSTPKNFSSYAQLRGQFLPFEGRSVLILVLLGTAIFIRRRSSVS